MTHFRLSPETETIGCGTPGCADPNCTYGRDDNWPPVKMALWRVLMDEQLNSGKYIKAFDLIEKLHAAVLTCGLAPRPKLPNREQIAKVIYAGWLDADFCTENHFRWFEAGKDNPDSCVHYSNVAKALKVADRVVALSDSSTLRSDLDMSECGDPDCGCTVGLSCAKSSPVRTKADQ